MLSRNDDSTKIITSSTSAPFQSSGRHFGSHSGTRLASKCLDSSAKPSSSPSRLVSSTHSWPRCVSPARDTPGLRETATTAILNSEITTQAADRDRQRVTMEQRDADQHQREQDEIDGDAGHRRRFDHRGDKRTAGQRGRGQQARAKTRHVAGMERASRGTSLGACERARRGAARRVFVTRIVACRPCPTSRDRRRRCVWPSDSVNAPGRSLLVSPRLDP